MNFTDALAIAVVNVGVSAERAAVGMRRLQRAFIMLVAHIEAGDWPDYFSLINRYLRTDCEPNNISGERWTA